MMYDRRPCPHCGSDTEHRLIVLDDGAFAWCQSCFRVTQTPLAVELAWAPPGNGWTPAHNSAAN